MKIFKNFKKSICKHNYVYTGKYDWYMTSDLQVIPCGIYKCSKCDNKTVINFHGKEVAIIDSNGKEVTIS